MRELNPLIEKLINDKIGGYDETTPNELVVRALQAMLGIHEEGGNNRGILVSAIQDTVGGPDHWAWCMSLQQTAVAFVEKKFSMVCDLAESEHCLTVFNAAKKAKRILKKPEIGSLVVWQHGYTQSGHVGCVTRISAMKDGWFVCIEGNTGGGSGIEREGDGVFEKIRNAQGSKEMRVLGYVKLSFLPKKSGRRA